MENQDVYAIYKLYKESYGRMDPRDREETGYNSSFISGIAHIHLADVGGEYDSRYVRVEIEDSEVVRVEDADSGEELPLDAVTEEDYERAIDMIIHQ